MDLRNYVKRQKDISGYKTLLTIEKETWNFTFVMQTLLVKSSSEGSISYSGTSRAFSTCMGVIYKRKEVCNRNVMS